MMAKESEDSTNKRSSDDDDESNFGKSILQFGAGS